MAAGRGRDSLLVLSAEVHTIELTLERTAFARNIKNLARSLVHSGHRRDFPFAARDLSVQLAGDTVEIEMPEAVTLAAPEELLSSVQEPEVLVEIDPVRILLGQNDARRTRGGVGEVKIETILHAIELLDCERA